MAQLMVSRGSGALTLSAGSGALTLSRGSGSKRRYRRVAPAAARASASAVAPSVRLAGVSCERGLACSHRRWLAARKAHDHGPELARDLLPGLVVVG